MRRGVMLRELEPLEEMISTKSIDTLMHRCNAHLVIDDELIGLRPKNVETKTVSNRKAGKEGSVADCVACSFTNVLYGVRLRVRGEKMVDNIHSLVDSCGLVTKDNLH